ncbi:MAG: hypothetical protein SOX82_03540 [Eubacteriales bacterium]|nr:hypothetical protein [Eubacteriales bacterium]MDY4212749.1 hypothetical protein [Eubacteriales bacterium]
MKTIGFVDYYINEWHANNYPKWIEKANEKLNEDFKLKYVWAEEYVSPVSGRNTDEWCAEHECEKCETIDELCEKSDYIIILAPSNPEKHLGYAREVLKHKKNTYIDKTFAPDYKTAKEIFDIAEKYGTSFFSSSALRYADELEKLKGAQNVITYGGGGNIAEYIIHQIEMVQTIIDEKPLSLKLERQGAQYICRVEYDNKKCASMIYASDMPFGICAETSDGESLYESISSPFFENLISEILKFFKTGESPFNDKQTLDIMKIRTGVIAAVDNLNTQIDL